MSKFRLPSFLRIVVLGIAGVCSGASVENPVQFQGICDASAVVGLNENAVAVANDEDNVIRIYSRDGGVPLWEKDFSAFLRVDPKNPETDIEAATRTGNRVYWLTSHGRNAKGKVRQSRCRFFATTVVAGSGQVVLQPEGQPYARLLDDLAKASKLARFNLAGAARLAPKSPGALNLEGLTALPNGELLIGFRNPIPGGRALAISLTNPADLLEAKPPVFGEPVLLNLDGFGIRSLEWTDDRFLIVAGSFGDGGRSRLFEWSGEGSPPSEVGMVNLKGLNPEGITTLHDGGGPLGLLIISDDGNREIDGKPCKSLSDPSRKGFGGLFVTPLPKFF